MAGIPEFKNIVLNSSLSGSTGAKLYKNTTGKKWVVKTGKKPNQCKQPSTEYLANQIYAALGIPVPRTKFDEPNCKLITEYIDGTLLGKATPEQFEVAKAELSKGFVVDALLGNWDVIGLLQDNIILPADGSAPVRIDNGGSFNLKATGGNKKLTNFVKELDAMRNSTMNPQAASVFGHLTDTDIDQQIKALIVPNYDRILSMIPDNLKEVMKKRLDYLVDRTVWTNATSFKNNVAESAEPSYIPQVEHALLKFFNKGVFNITNIVLLEKLKNLLIDYGAIVSGGFILQAIGAFIDPLSVDIDIYVPTVHAREFRAELEAIFKPDNVLVTQASKSGQSSLFFKKNGIVSVSKYIRNAPKYTEMDIIEVNSDRTPIHVVKNFDLTFCENWYDGKMVYMTYPEHVKTKSGFLENHYLHILFARNPVLLGRMKKYIKRGFKISINNPSTTGVENITELVREDKFMSKYANNGANNNENIMYGSYASQAPGAPFPNILMNTIANSVIQPSMNSSDALLAINARNAVNANIAPPELTELALIDRIAISTYTGPGYHIINTYLYGSKIPGKLYYNIKNMKLFKILANKFPISDGETPETYINRILYYYFVNLYNGIVKAPKPSARPFKVYRGSRTWYMNADLTKFYYINSFVSTSVELRPARGFGYRRDAIAPGIKYGVYTYYTHPACKYMNVMPLSGYGAEKEVLFTPYHRYFFIREEVQDDTMYQIYVILPTDLTIPKSFETFDAWRTSVASMSRNRSQSGGRIALSFKHAPKNTTRTRLIAKKNVRRNTTRRMVNKTSTVPVKTNTVPVPAEDLSRFTDPLPSFAGKPPTAEEKDVIQQIVNYFEKK